MRVNTCLQVSNTRLHFNNPVYAYRTELSKIIKSVIAFFNVVMPTIDFLIYDYCKLFSFVGKEGSQHPPPLPALPAPPSL